MEYGCYAKYIKWNTNKIVNNKTKQNKKETTRSKLYMLPVTVSTTHSLIYIDENLIEFTHDVNSLLNFIFVFFALFKKHYILRLVCWFSAEKSAVISPIPQMKQFRIVLLKIWNSFKFSLSHFIASPGLILKV